MISAITPATRNQQNDVVRYSLPITLWSVVVRTLTIVSPLALLCSAPSAPTVVRNTVAMVPPGVVGPRRAGCRGPVPDGAPEKLPGHCGLTGRRRAPGG